MTDKPASNISFGGIKARNVEVVFFQYNTKIGSTMVYTQHKAQLELFGLIEFF